MSLFRTSRLLFFQILIRLRALVKLEALEQIAEAGGGIFPGRVLGKIRNLLLLLYRSILEHLHAQADLAVCDSGDPDLDLVAFFDNFRRILDALLAHL